MMKYHHVDKEFRSSAQLLNDIKDVSFIYSLGTKRENHCVTVNY